MTTDTDINIIAALSLQLLDDHFREKATEKVARHCCNGNPCEELCDVARHDIMEVCLYEWQKYARRN